MTKFQSFVENIKIEEKTVFRVSENDEDDRRHLRITKHTLVYQANVSKTSKSRTLPIIHEQVQTVAIGRTF